MDLLGAFVHEVHAPIAGLEVDVETVVARDDRPVGLREGRLRVSTDDHQLADHAELVVGRLLEPVGDVPDVAEHHVPPRRQRHRGQSRAPCLDAHERWSGDLVKVVRDREGAQGVVPKVLYPSLDRRVADPGEGKLVADRPPVLEPNVDHATCELRGGFRIRVVDRDERGSVRLARCGLARSRLPRFVVVRRGAISGGAAVCHHDNRHRDHQRPDPQ